MVLLNKNGFSNAAENKLVVLEYRLQDIIEIFHHTLMYELAFGIEREFFFGPNALNAFPLNQDVAGGVLHIDDRFPLSWIWSHPDAYCLFRIQENGGRLEVWDCGAGSVPPGTRIQSISTGR